MKRLLSLLLAVLLCTGCLVPAFASYDTERAVANKTWDGEKYTIADGVVYCLISGKNPYYSVASFFADKTALQTVRELAIPAEIDGIPVKAVNTAGVEDTVEGCFCIATGYPSFAQRKTAVLEKVVLPDSVVFIGHSAFRGMTNLKSVRFPAKLRKIWNAAFFESGLEEALLPETLTFLGPDAFGGCKSLRSVSIPGGIRKLRGYTFRFCEALETVTLGKGLLSIGAHDFEGTGLKAVKLPKGLIRLGSCAFSASKLEKLYLPRSVTKLDSAFSNCRSLKKVVFQDRTDTLSLIHKEFTKCRRLEVVKLPPSAASVEIGGRAFEDCRSLKKITGLQAVTTVTESAFKGSPFNIAAAPGFSGEVRAS